VNPEIEGVIGENLRKREELYLSPFATKSSEAVRERPEEEDLLRPPFSRDADRILHSRAYTRYIDKTQAFYLFENDHITHRVLHVQLVSKIARQIGRCLGLNEDLIEAIALGHDIGHVPFGHEGEEYLSELCQEHGLPPLLHNVQGVRLLARIEGHGRGVNLTLQTLDGILCHDGEVHSVKLQPQRDKDWERLWMEVRAKEEDPELPLVPMTLEGCVVRMADTISYIGRDVEDAITIRLIKREDLPRDVVRVLGNTNRDIVNTLVRDLIFNSYGKPYVAFSPEVSEALRALKEFNYENIYHNPAIKTESGKIRDMFRVLFKRYLRDLEEGRKDSAIWEFYASMDDDYKAETSPAGVVRDFIAGMTDDFFRNQFEATVMPRSFGYAVG